MILKISMASAVNKVESAEKFEFLRYFKTKTSLITYGWDRRYKSETVPMTQAVGTASLL